MRFNEIIAILTKDYSITKRAVKLIQSFTPNYFLHSFLFAFDLGLMQYVGYYLAAEIMDEVTTGRDIKKMALMVGIMVISEISLELLSKYSWRRIRVNEIITQQWEEIYLNKKSFSMDYKNLEDPDIRAKRQAIVDNRSLGGLNSLVLKLSHLMRLIINIFFSTLMLSDLFFRHSEKELTGIVGLADTWVASFVLGIVIVISCGISFISVHKVERHDYNVNKKISSVKKLYTYYLDDYLDDSKACKDVHIFNQKSLIDFTSDKIHSNWLKLIKEKADFWRKHKEKTAVLKYFITGIIYAFVALKAVAGTFGIGSFVKYSTCIQKLLLNVNGLGSLLSEMHSNCKYIEDFFSYVDIPTEMHYGTIPTEKRMDNKYDIEFHNVSFKYPNTEKYVIKNLNLKFKVGDRIAVVGMNGSGKTTMIKLLCRLYDPTEGYITLNGIDIQKYDYEDYLKLFSVVFQDFKLFSFSVGENVAASVDYDEEKVWSSLEKAGMLERVKQMPKGLKTPVYKDFEESGVEISGGEAQKLAIARALYKDAAFVILDEPTASLDPIAEHEIYSRFNDMVKDKTAIYISHRLSSCRFCDRILVFDNGRLIQDGSHENLLENTGGKYSELWNAQAQYYAENKTVIA
ncbi:MAG: ABC transporter ATP-binding protein [Clostridia bacterium]|nr:ABC transporter ATP-binding protein [Clostridia bacterium]